MRARVANESPTETSSEEAATFNARLTKRVKSALQRAADIRGQSLSDFVLGAAYDRALETISTAAVVKLSERDSALFARALAEDAVVDPAVLARFLEGHQKAVR
jgi:uncharacterized protein (DUF1778 family)